MDLLSERVKFARERLGMSQQDVADATGMSQPSYFKIEAGKTKRTTYINKLAKVLKVQPEWLENGTGEMEITNSHDSQPSKDTANNDTESQYVIIGGASEYDLVQVPYLDIKASCGPGYANVENPEAHTQAFTVEFLRENGLPHDGKGLVLMHACSDSMGYTIPHGTLMLVNTNEREYDNFINNKIYVFNADGEMMCKRAVKSLDGTVILKSDNSDKETYPDQVITRDTFSQFRLFGRVRYTFNRY